MYEARFCHPHVRPGHQRYILPPGGQKEDPKGVCYEPSFWQCYFCRYRISIKNFKVFLKNIPRKFTYLCMGFSIYFYFTYCRQSFLNCTAFDIHYSNKSKVLSIYIILFFIVFSFIVICYLSYLMIPKKLQVPLTFHIVFC